MSQGIVISQPSHHDKGRPDMQMNPVVTQPGMGLGQQGTMMAPLPNIVIPYGLPPSMAYLQSLNEIKVHQILELAEVLIGWERNNKYDICNSLDQKFMFAKEDTDCCTRQLCGVMRPFVMNVSDLQGIPLMTLHRPFRCQGSIFWCCYLQEMEIQSPPGVLQGKVKEIWTCCIPKYKVYDAQNQCVFTIVGDCCYCKCCVDVVFKVFEGDTEGPHGTEDIQILKHWGGCREVFGGANDFSINFPADLDLMKKVLLFGATFLIDFNYFEYRGNQ